jgi:hypothetical protein
MKAFIRLAIFSGFTLILLSSLAQFWLVQTNFRIKVPVGLEYAVLIGWCLLLPASITSNIRKEKINRFAGIALLIAVPVTILGSLRIGAV